MPHLTADALTNDPDGMALLAAVLAAPVAEFVEAAPVAAGSKARRSLRVSRRNEPRSDMPQPAIASVWVAA